MVNLSFFVENSLRILPSSKSPLGKFFFLILAAQLAFRPEYDSAPDYLTRQSPKYNPDLPEDAGLLGSIINLLLLILGPPNVADNACERMKHGSDLTFDFIVVGGGAAGSVIAATLSENPKWKVLLIEAGSDPYVESVAPGYVQYGLNTSALWRYNSEVTNTSCQAFKNGCPMMHGRQLGGSTGINAMLYVCGQDRDYDGWAAQGNPGWSYKEILKYIMLNENNGDRSLDPAFHGYSGKLNVSTYPIINPMVNRFRAAFNEMGYKTLKDINAGEGYNGFVELQGLVRAGERCSAYQAFIQPIKDRSNLFIVKNGLVTNVLFEGKKAVGVNVKTSRTDCPNIVFKASKETIISAGGLNSPKILLQSGIGPKAHLEKVGINVTLDLPGVGQNLDDHFMALHFIRLNPGAPPQEDKDVILNIENYIKNRTGNGAHIGTPNAEGFINTTDPNSKYSDIQFCIRHGPKSADDILQLISNFGYKDKYLAKIKEMNDGYQFFLVFTILLNPISRGTYELRSSDPSQPPKIVSNFLTNEDDIQTILRGINKLKEFTNTSTFNGTSIEFVNFDIEECNSFAFMSDDYNRCYIKYMSTSLWHPTGTCKMGPASDKQAVVNATLNVHGISNLRVADASIMPNITHGNTVAPTYAIGGKAADMIRTFWAGK